MTDHDIGQIAVDMLKKRLPGFESKIDAGRDEIVIRGALPISYHVSNEAIVYPLYRGEPFEGHVARALRDVTETDDMRAARIARERARIEELITPSVDHIDDTIKSFGIKALGLEAYIIDRETRARERGRSEGYAAGRDLGKREGREAAAAEFRELLKGIIDE